MREVGTLREIGAQVGDVVVFGNEPTKYLILAIKTRDATMRWTRHDGSTVELDEPLDSAALYRIIRRANRPFKDLTREEKDDLIMAHVDEKIIEVSIDGGATWERCYTPLWAGSVCYRVKSDVTERVSIRSSYPFAGWVSEEYGNIDETHRITFQTVNGKPDCNSISMEEL